MSGPNKNEQELWSSWKAGEETAFDQLFRIYFPSLRYYAEQQLKDPDAAEDIVQECFIKLWNGRQKIQDISTISSYLYKMIRNACLLYLSKKPRVRNATTQESTTEKSPEQLIVESEIVFQLNKTIEALPPRMREVIKLCFLEGKSCRETSEIMGIHIKTVEQQRFRALQLLRKVNTATR